MWEKFPHKELGMVEVFHIILGAMIAFGGAAAYLHIAHVPEDEGHTDAPHRASHLSLVTSRGDTASG